MATGGALSTAALTLGTGSTVAAGGKRSVSVRGLRSKIVWRVKILHPILVGAAGAGESVGDRRGSLVAVKCVEAARRLLVSVGSCSSCLKLLTMKRMRGRLFFGNVNSIQNLPPKKEAVFVLLCWWLTSRKKIYMFYFGCLTVDHEGFAPARSMGNVTKFA